MGPLRLSIAKTAAPRIAIPATIPTTGIIIALPFRFSCGLSPLLTTVPSFPLVFSTVETVISGVWSLVGLLEGLGLPDLMGCAKSLEFGSKGVAVTKLSEGAARVLV